MTRKDYQTLAKAFHAVRNTYDGSEGGDDGAQEAMRRCELQIADVLARDSVRFDADRFLAACVTGGK